jgi:hypothetical protein
MNPFFFAAAIFFLGFRPAAIDPNSSPVQNHRPAKLPFYRIIGPLLDRLLTESGHDIRDIYLN